MTTNVTDLKAGKMACESRWSVSKPDFVLYIDNTGFDKIVLHGRSALMFAGNGRLIQEWKDWLHSKPANSKGHPPVNGVAVCIANMTSSVVMFDRGQDIKRPSEEAPVALFAGSGAYHAHTCWTVNADALKAVESAKNVDLFSGGDVKHVIFACGSHNVGNTATIDDVHQMLVMKGTVMYHKNPKVGSPVLEAAANDKELQKVVDAITSGALSADAPCDSMYSAWSAQEVRALETALDIVLSN